MTHIISGRVIGAFGMFLLSGCVIGPFDLKFEKTYLVDRRELVAYRNWKTMLSQYPIGVAIEMSSSAQFWGKSGSFDESFFCDEKPLPYRFSNKFFHILNLDGAESVDGRNHYVTILSPIEQVTQAPGHTFYDLATDTRDVCIFITATNRYFQRSNTIRVTHAEILGALHEPIKPLALSPEH